MRWALSSVRQRALIIVAIVVLLPLLSVWLSGTFETGSAMALRSMLRTAAARGLAAVDGDLEAVARRSGVRLRVVRGEVVLADYDHAPNVILEPLADPFFGPAGAPDLHTLDDRLPPLPSRQEVRDAHEKPHASCTVDASGQMLMCAATVRTSDGRVLHVSRGSARLVRSLYERRFQLTALTIAVAVVGGLLGWWLGFSLVSPIEALRSQVVARSRGPASTEPVPVDRSDEIGELAKAFNELLAALEDRNQANAAFVADLAHELKNPVAAVSAAAEALAADHELTAGRRDRLQRVLADSASRMEVVVHGFLELARAEAGLPGVEREPVDVAELVRGVVRRFASDERYTSVTFEVDTEPATVLAASERLETAVSNLLANAAHFGGPNGTVRVGVQASEAEVRVVVTDCGPGIEPDELPTIFERYVSARHGGTGLGLALVRAIAQAHGGGVHVVSDAGATFTLSLPSCSARPA